MGAQGYDSIPTHSNESAAAPPPPPPPGLRAQVLAEFIGTAILVQVGTGANCLATFSGTTDGMWQIAVIWILAATLAIYAVGSVSGGHLNPAVTLSFALLRSDDVSLAQVVPYWMAQVAGGMVGALINMTIFYKAVVDFETKAGLTRGSLDSIQSAAAFSDYWSLSDYVDNTLHAFFLEAFGTAFLVFVVFAVTNPKNNVPGAAVAPLVGVAIGAMVTLIGPLTNAGINPARDFGPRLAAFISGWGMASFQDCFVYVVAPLVGGPIGAFVADKVLFL